MYIHMSIDVHIKTADFTCQYMYIHVSMHACCRTPAHNRAASGKPPHTRTQALSAVCVCFPLFVCAFARGAHLNALVPLDEQIERFEVAVDEVGIVHRAQPVHGVE